MSGDDSELIDDIRVRITETQAEVIDAFTEGTELENRSEVVRFALDVLTDVTEGRGIVLRGTTNRLVHETAQETDIPPKDIARAGAVLIQALLKSAPTFKETLDDILDTVNIAEEAMAGEGPANPDESPGP